VSLKRKYEEGSDYMYSIATLTVKQNRLIEMRGPTGPTQSRKTQTILPTCKDKNATLMLMPSTGPLMVHGFIPKVDQEESIHIIHNI
jgi:hypothetical protein